MRRIVSLPLASLFSLAFVPYVAFAQKAKAPVAKPILNSGQIGRVFFHGFWESVLMLWYVWLILAALAFGQLFFAYRRKAALAASGIAEIDQIDGRTFEQYLATLFQRLGYAVELTAYVGDWGGDLVLQKDGVKTVVQAKRYKKAVGVRAVQEAVTANQVRLHRGDGSHQQRLHPSGRRVSTGQSRYALGPGAIGTSHSLGEK